MTTVASNLRTTYDLPSGATLTLTLEGPEPATGPEVELFARLVSTIERSTVLKEVGE